MPGTIFIMVGLGIALAVLEFRYPKPGRITYYVALAGVLLWYFGAWQNISFLAPLLFIGFFQLSRFVVRLSFEPS